MKKLFLLLSLGIGVAIATTGCQKEADEITTEENRFTEETVVAEAQMFEIDAETFEDMLAAQVGVSANCKKVDVCSKGKIKSISKNAAYVHVKNGDLLFSCDADDGLEYSEVVTILFPRIVARGADPYDEGERKDEFLTWFDEMFCGTGTPGGSDPGDGGTFEDGGGTNL